MSIRGTLDNLPDISFIENMTLDDIKKQMVNDFQQEYERLTGNELSLGLADPNRIVLYACALQSYQTLQYVDKAGKMGLLKYSTGDFLDMLGALKGITRNEAKASITRLKFTLSEKRLSAIPIEKGTQVTNGTLYFETDEYVEIPAGELSIEVSATCTIKGSVGNDILPGEIKNITIPIQYIDKVENTTITENGCEIEENERFAERIHLAPASYSVAGPDLAYEFWVKTYNTEVTDVKVTSPDDGIVDIRFIVNDGEIPGSSAIEEMTELIKNNKIRPLTDKVQISAPGITQYDLDVTYYINSSDLRSAVMIKNKVEEAVEEYKTWQHSKIGRDINPSKLVNLIIKAGAKRAVVNSPIFTKVEETSVAQINTENIIYGGLEDD